MKNEDRNESILSIIEIINMYFKATYQGQKNILENIFYPDAVISGYIENFLQVFTLAQFIERVTASPTAAQKKELFDKKIILIDNTNNISMVKTKVRVEKYYFTDYLTLIQENHQWRIKCKYFTHHAEEIKNV